MDPAIPPSAQIIDPAVLAERRARRAELSEETLERRAGSAEARALDLEHQLSALQRRLAESAADRDRLSQELTEAQDALRAGRQREYSEQRQRVEAEEQLQLVRAAGAAQVRGLREELERAEGQIATLTEELERLRREAAETEQEVRASEAAARRRLHAELVQREELLAAAQADLEERLGEAREAERRVSASHEELEGRRAELEQARVEARRGALALRESESTLAEVRSELATLAQTLERERRAHAERQGSLEAELVRERRAHDERERSLQAELVREREASEAHLADATAELRARIEQQRTEFQSQVGAIHSTVAQVRTRLHEAISEAAQRTLSERTALERIAEIEVRARDRVRQAADRVHEAEALVAGLHRSSVAAAEGERAAVGDLRAELETVRAELRTRAEHEAELERIQVELRAQLQAESAARQAAEALALPRRALGAPPDAGPPREADPPRDADPPQPPPSAAAEALVHDLSEAVRRLRERMPQEGDAPRAAVQESGAEAPADAGEGTFRAPADPPSRRRDQSPWLSRSIARMAEFGDRRLAARLILELLPAQGVFVAGPVSYDLEIEELGTHRVVIGQGRATVTPLPAGQDGTAVDFAIRAPAQALGPLVAGAARHRLRGAAVSGRRRRLRRLLRSMRRPVGLEDLVAAGVPVDPGLMLAALTAAIDPRWTEGHRFTVDFLLGDPAASLRLRIGDGEPIRVTRPPSTAEPAATTTVTLTGGAFLNMLAGRPLRPSEQPEISGDASALERVNGWFARAQGSDSRA